MFIRSIAAAAVIAALVAATPASAATRHWDRTFRYVGATDTIPFIPKDVRCYTLPGVQLKRTFLSSGIAFGGGATSRDPFRLVYRARTRRVTALMAPYYCSATSVGGRPASRRARRSWRSI